MNSYSNLRCMHAYILLGKQMMVGFVFSWGKNLEYNDLSRFCQQYGCVQKFCMTFSMI